MIPKQASYLLLAALLSAGCACHNDIDDDSKFAAVRDHLFVTKQPMHLYYGEENPIGTVTPGSARATTAAPGSVLTTGTLIRPVQLSGNTCESGGVVVTIQIESGPYSGQRANVKSDQLFLNPYPADRSNQPAAVVQWEANPVLLEPARN
ncbi:MAG TPA: hypothetical protein VFE47_23245 [Tepidisphaeraceae bacterium]|jgi:hypothetical protein|nr:hypothetical protein [Tepidisphaeraceae bacterium]